MLPMPMMPSLTLFIPQSGWRSAGLRPAAVLSELRECCGSQSRAPRIERDAVAQRRVPCVWRGPKHNMRSACAPDTVCTIVIRLFSLPVAGQLLGEVLRIVNFAQCLEDRLRTDGDGARLFVGVGEVEHERLEVAVENDADELGVAIDDRAAGVAA